MPTRSLLGSGPSMPFQPSMVLVCCTERSYQKKKKAPGSSCSCMSRSVDLKTPPLPTIRPCGCRMIYQECWSLMHGGMERANKRCKLGMKNAPAVQCRWKVSRENFCMVRYSNVGNSCPSTIVRSCLVNCETVASLSLPDCRAGWSTRHGGGRVVGGMEARGVFETAPNGVARDSD